MATFADALTASFVGKLDPMNGVMRSYAESQTKEANEDLKAKVLDTMDRLRRTIKECQDNGEDPQVIAAYQRMLDSYTK
jgi:molecular chaperone GrpE (heat shock protein)